LERLPGPSLCVLWELIQLGAADPEVPAPPCWEASAVGSVRVPNFHLAGLEFCRSKSLAYCAENAETIASEKVGEGGGESKRGTISV